MSTNIKRWIDLESPEFEKVENPNAIKKLVKRGLELGAITIDKHGYMKSGDNIIHVEIGSELVGLRYTLKAVN